MNEATRIAYAKVTAWIDYQKQRIEEAKRDGDYGRAVRLEMELRRVLNGKR